MRFVRSTFRKNWSGVVIGSREHRGGAVCVVVVLLRANGTPPPRRRIETIHENWLSAIPPLDLVGVNPDWLLPLKGIA